MSDIPDIPTIQNNNIQNSNPNIPYINIGVNGVRYISNIGNDDPSIPEVREIGTRRIGVNGVPSAVPPDPPVVVNIGKPIVDMPGCVQVHKENVKQESRNKQLVNDDPKGNTVLCDSGAPSFYPVNYDPRRLKLETIYGDAPEITGGVDTGDPPVPPEAPGTPEPPKTPSDTKEDPPCPGPLAPRIGDVAQSQKEKVSGFELQRDPKNPDGVKICVTLYEDINFVEAYLPSPQVASTTAVIASVAGASALLAKPLADLLLRVFRPVIKKVLTKVNAVLGKTPYRPTQAELRTNEYRKKKDLNPIPFAKNHQKKMKEEKKREAEKKKAEKNSQT